ITVSENIGGGTGGVTLEATEDIIVDDGIQISATGSGDISLTAERNLSLGNGSGVTSENGDVTLSANQQAIAASGNFIGVDAENAQIQSSGSGNVTISGRGGDTDEDNHGVRIAGTSS